MAKKLEEGMLNILKKTAKGFLKDVVNTENPPYLTGSYMASHRVGINKADTSDIVFNKPGSISLGAAKARSLVEMEKIDGAKEGDTIYISNSVGYSKKGYSWARNVEYAGWNGRGPYMVYEKAIAKIPQNIKKYITEVTKEIETK